MAVTCHPGRFLLGVVAVNFLSKAASGEEEDLDAAGSLWSVYAVSSERLRFTPVLNLGRTVILPAYI
jgi:hypothetical protein